MANQNKPSEDTSTANINDIFGSIPKNVEGNARPTVDDELRDYFKSHKDRHHSFTERNKHILPSIKNKILKFVKVTAVAAGTLLVAHHYTTPEIDTSNLSQDKAKIAQEVESFLGAGMSNTEIAFHQMARKLDSILPESMSFMTKDAKQRLAQATLNHMMKNYPAYPELNDKFLVENPKNTEVRVSVMKNLIMSDFFKKHPDILKHYENQFFYQSMEKFRDAPVNQTTMFPFSYAKDVQVGTKIIDYNTLGYKATGKIFDTPSDSSEELKSAVKQVNKLGRAATYLMHIVASPSMKFAGLFSSEDAMKAYEFDPAKVNNVAFRNLSNTPESNIPLLDNEHLTKEQNIARNKVLSQVNTDPEAFRKGIAMSTEADLAAMRAARDQVMAKHTAANQKKSKQADLEATKARDMENIKNILQKASQIVQPDPNTVEADKEKGLKLIEELKKPKP